MIKLNHILKRQFDPGSRLAKTVGKMLRAYEMGNKPAYLLLREIIFRNYACCISPLAKIGMDIKFPHPCGVVIGDGVSVGSRCTIYQQVTLGQSRNAFPVLGDDVIVYAGAKIVGNVHVGARAVIGANSVVTKDVPPNAIVGGIPAKVLKIRDSEEDGDLY